MKLGLVVLGVFLVGSTLGLLAATPWQDAKAKEKPAGGGDKSMPFTEQEMAAFQESMTPGPQHKEMARLVGSWNVQSRFWMKPGSPAQEGTGTSEFKMVLGGRYLSEDYSGTCPMGTFHGMGLMAFNNTTKQWEHVWLDDMGTGMMFAQGGAQDGGTELRATFTCPLTGQKVNSRTVVKSISEDERTVDMWSTYPGQPEYQSMSLHYTRAGSAPKTPNAR